MKATSAASSSKKGMKRLSAPAIHGKVGLRASFTGERN
jgi:hypothetical protein